MKVRILIYIAFMHWLKDGDDDANDRRPKPGGLSHQGFIDLDKILHQATALVGADRGSLQLHDPKIGLVLVAAQGFSTAFIDQFRHLPLDAGTPCTRAFLAARPTIMADCLADGDYRHLRERFDVVGVRSCRSVPLLDHAGRPFGVVSMHARTPHPQIDWEEEVLRLHGRQVARRVEELFA